MATRRCTANTKDGTEGGTVGPSNVAKTISLVKDVMTILAVVIGAVWALYLLYVQHEREDVIYRGRAVAVSASCKIDYIGATKTSYLYNATISIGSAAKISVHVVDSPYMVSATIIRPFETSRSKEESTESIGKQYQTHEPFQEASKAAKPEEIPLEYGRLWDTQAVVVEPGEKFRPDTRV